MRRYRDKRIPDEQYSPGWHDVYAEELEDGRVCVELQDGDAMGGSRNTVLLMGRDQFNDRYEKYA